MAQGKGNLERGARRGGTGRKLIAVWIYRLPINKQYQLDEEGERCLPPHPAVRGLEGARLADRYCLATACLHPATALGGRVQQRVSGAIAPRELVEIEGVSSRQQRAQGGPVKDGAEAEGGGRRQEGTGSAAGDQEERGCWRALGADGGEDGEAARAVRQEEQALPAVVVDQQEAGEGQAGALVPGRRARAAPLPALSARPRQGLQQEPLELAQPQLPLRLPQQVQGRLPGIDQLCGEEPAGDLLHPEDARGVGAARPQPVRVEPEGGGGAAEPRLSGVLAGEVPGRRARPPPQGEQVPVMISFPFSEDYRIDFYMSLSKDPYVPSPFTLTLLDNFGTKRLPRPNTHNSTTHLSHHRSEARLRPAFDKESLLEQLRREKAKARQMNASSGYLRRQLSHSKQPAAVPAAAAVLGHRSIACSLKRELEALAGQVQAQGEEIARIKASKKYNRHAELLTAKQVYEDELRAAAKHTAKNRYALRERKRMWHEHRHREEETEAMDRAVKARLVQENRALAEQIKEEDSRISANLQRQAAQLRERSRLVRDILQLQKSTGKLYIVEGEEEATENEETGEKKKALQPPPNLYEEDEQQSEDILKTPKGYKESSASSHGHSSEEEDSSCSSSDGEAGSPSAPLPRRANLSF